MLKTMFKDNKKAVFGKIFNFEILGFWWEAELVPADSEKLRYFEGTKQNFSLGNSSGSCFKIHLDESVPRQNLLRIFLHELTHAILTTLVPCSNYSLFRLNDEGVCDFISNYYYLISKIQANFENFLDNSNAIS